MKFSALTAERRPTKIAAEYLSASSARETAEELLQEPCLSRANVTVISPADPDLEKKLEPEAMGIQRTLIRTHVIWGIVGLVVGMAVAGLLMLMGIAAALASPYYSVGVLGALGLMLGLMLGGFFSLRPDHDPLILKVRTASSEGKYCVLVHISNLQQRQVVQQFFKSHGKAAISTL
jgi:hypothetical protein